MDVEKKVDESLIRIQNKIKLPTFYIEWPGLGKTEEDRQKRMQLLKKECLKAACALVIYYLLLFYSLCKFFLRELVSFIGIFTSDLAWSIFWAIFIVIFWLSLISFFIAKSYIDKHASRVYGSSLDSVREGIAKKELDDELLKLPGVNEQIIREHALPYLEKKIERKEQHSFVTAISKAISPAAITFSAALVTAFFSLWGEEFANDDSFREFAPSAFMIMFMLILIGMMVLGVVINGVLLIFRNKGSRMRSLILLRKAILVYSARKDANCNTRNISLGNKRMKSSILSSSRRKRQKERRNARRRSRRLGPRNRH